MKERIVIVFIAVALGLLVTTAGFFLYQQTKILPKSANQKNISPKASPTPENKTYLSIEEPANESISDKRTISIKGKTNPENTLIISTNQEDIVVSPTSEGGFSATITIDTGTNKVVTRAVSPNGDERIDTRIITYSQEDF